MNSVAHVARARRYARLADHTSVIRFLERRFGVVEPNISAWRRAVCGDLTGAFDFTRSDAAAFGAALPDTRPARDAALAIKGQLAPQAPANPAQPVQERGIRRARPLPYHPEVRARTATAADRIALDFSNAGTRALVLHVYDRLHLDRIPRRYTVAPGDNVQGEWFRDGTDGGYDLWVLGPNGFHRHFAGDRVGVDMQPELEWRVADGAVTLTIPAGRSTMRVTAASYTQHHADWTPPAAGGSQRWSLAATAGWYDLIVLDEARPRYRRRLAGRLEDGRPGVTDPAMA